MKVVVELQILESGRARDVHASTMANRKVDICVQETRWLRSKARNIGDGYTLLYHGEDGRGNGVGVILK